MLNKHFFCFDRFYTVWTDKTCYFRKQLSIPLRDGSTHFHFSCECYGFKCHYDTFSYDEAKRLKLEMFVK